MSASDLRSDMSKARGLGSAHHGVSHWWWQRVTALALIPLSVWFVYSLVTVVLSPSVTTTAQWFASPINSIVMVLMLLATFIHAKLGLQVVIEDYVKSPFNKYALLLLNLFICVVFASVSILAVLKLHFLYVSVTM
ncbi:MAG: succinate dehydrogenase, hydrophobic membrane anchor protein [Rickettsiales bacterium]|nr:succinate dehydrogenase, hydrophobic membrane anchor protein [Rickettsiales bacterium]